MSTDTIAVSERIDDDEISEQLQGFFEEETIIQNEIHDEIFSPPFRITNIPIGDYCNLEQLTTMQSIEVNVTPPPPPNQMLLGIKDYVVGASVSHLFLANRELVIPHIQGTTPTIQIRNYADKLINSGFEIFEQTEIINGERFTMFCYIPYISGKKIFGFGKVGVDFTNKQRFFSVGTCKEDEILPSFELPPLEFRPLTDGIGETDKIICSNTSARFRKMSTVWDNIGDAINELNEMLISTIDPNYMEKIMRLNMYFTVSNAHING